MTEPSIWDVRDNLDYDLPLDPGDSRLVPLNDARGQFSDILLPQANALLETLEADRVPLEQVFLTRLQTWFEERIERHEKTREFAAQVRAGAKVETRVPLLGKLLAELTNSVRLNSTYKDEVRTVIRNTFSEFAGAFNQLIVHANQSVADKGLGRCILFVVDGTDRLSGEDKEHFCGLIS